MGGYWNKASESKNLTKCSTMCGTCDNGTTCTACATNYKKKVDDTASNHKCFDSSNEPQKYFYSAKKTLQKCHKSCATCSDETAAKCKSCADTYKKIADKTGEYQCYNSKPYPAGYWNKASESKNLTKCSTMCGTCDNGTTCTACATNYKKK